MSDEVSTENLIETKDYWTMMALEACGHVAEIITSKEANNGRNTVLVYFFSKEIEPDYDAWMRGASGPVSKIGTPEEDYYRYMFDVVRKVQQSSTQFKNNLHRYCR